MRTLADLIEFNEEHAEQEMPWFGQEIFYLAEATTGLDDPAYLAALKASGPVMRKAIDATLAKHDLDAVVSLTGAPPWTTDLVNGDHFLTGSSTPAAVAGYPSISVPAGFSHGELPVGISFIGGRWAEPTLLKLAYGFEQGTKARHAPRFVPSLGVRDFVRRDTGARPGGRGRHGRPRRTETQPARRNPVAGSV
jgi:amidase